MHFFHQILDDLIVDEGLHIDDVRFAQALQHSRVENSQETLIRWYSRIYTGEGTMHDDEYISKETTISCSNPFIRKMSLSVQAAIKR